MAKSLDHEARVFYESDCSLQLLQGKTVAIIGFGYACVIVNTFPIIWEMSQGSDIGKYTGYYYTASMAAQIVTPMLAGALIEKLDNYGILFPYAVIMEIIAFVLLMQVKHGDSKPVQPKDKLEALDVGDD